ncbi:hypothetical protein BDZ91DRAFT_189070 [Kalaharituber pfeilii]|nr:hypothetical protein BDZ91DRAFT_189070 [Kalaharituber pfeilii]
MRMSRIDGMAFISFFLVAPPPHCSPSPLLPLPKAPSQAYLAHSPLSALPARSTQVSFDGRGPLGQQVQHGLDHTEPSRILSILTSQVINQLTNPA